MNNKDREAMEYYKNALYGDKSVSIPFKQGFERGLEYARKEQKELLEKCEEALILALSENDGCELNLCNYDYDGVCNLNNGYIGLWQGIEQTLAALHAAKGKE